MAASSEYSSMGRVMGRTQHLAQEPMPEKADDRTETYLTAVGALFENAREPNLRPNSLELSEGEDATRNTHEVTSSTEAMLSSSAEVNSISASLGSSPSTPTPNQALFGPYVSKDDFGLILKSKKRRRAESAAGAKRIRRSAGTPGKLSTQSDRSSDAAETRNIGDERDRNRTPTTYISQSYTPSRHSSQSDEHYKEEKEPMPPFPFSEYSLYDARPTMEAIEDANTYFPVEEQPCAE